MLYLKNLALILLTFALVFGVSSGVLVLADNSNPGQMLYSLDRGVESLTLRLSKSMGNRSYGNVNLRLADERLREVKYVTEKSNVSSLVFKTYAQDALNSDNEIIKQLIADFNQNIKEVLNAFNNEGSTEKDIVLAREIAKRTTEFSNKLVDILSEVEDEVEEELEETSSILEDLDDDAVGALVEDSSDDESSKDRSLTIEKVTKTILKVSEKLTKTKEDIQEKGAEKKLTSEETLSLSEDLAGIESKLDLAKVALGNGELRNAYVNAKEAKNAISKLRDYLDALEADEKDDSQEDEDSQEEDDSNDDENEDKPRDNSNKGSSDDKDDDDRSGSNSRDDSEDEDEKEDSDDNSGSDDDNSDDNDEQEPDDSDDDDDVKGVGSTNSSTLLIDLIF